jgi:hypothetical protein
MTEERRQRILQIADELEAAGEVATNSAVYARALGHRGHVVSVMQARRAERVAQGGVLVAEEEEDEEPEEEAETPAAVLQEDLAQLEQSYDAWHLALERLWQIEQDGPLSEANFSRKQWLEYQMVQNIQTKNTLLAQLERATVREAVAGAVQEHDVRLTEAHAQAEAMLQAIATLHDRIEDLTETFAAQVDRLFAFRDPKGMQAFDVQSGFDQVRQLFESFFPSDPRARDAYLLLMQSPITIGRLRAALAGCARLQPFSTTAIASYLNSMVTSTSNQQTEGSANGHL